MRSEPLALLATLVAIAFLPSCARIELKREMRRFMASEIVLPERMEKSQGGTFAPVFREELAGPKMVVFIDSTECTSCRLSKLIGYEEVEKLSESTGNFSLVIVISTKRSEESKVRDFLLCSDIPFPVYLDTEHEFRGLNPSISDDVRFHSFFLDGSGHPLFIGNPAGSSRMMALLETKVSNFGTKDAGSKDGGVFALRKYCMDAVRIGVPEMAEALSRAGIGLVGSGTGVFVPPYVCRECLSQEVEVVKSLEMENLIVVVPEFRRDSLQRQFSGIDAADVRSYPESSVAGSEASSYEGIIYFRVTNSRISDIYLSSSEAPEATEAFLEKF